MDFGASNEATLTELPPAPPELVARELKAELLVEASPARARTDLDERNKATNSQRFLTETTLVVKGEGETTCRSILDLPLVHFLFEERIGTSQWCWSNSDRAEVV